MKKIVAIIEKANDGGYGIYTSTDEPIWGYGLTEKEARKDFLEILEEQAQYYKLRENEYPDWYIDGYEVEYRYDMSGFFLRFPFINVSEFAKSIGINPSLMRKYKSGLATASNKQKEIIQGKFNEIIRELEQVRF